MRKLASVQVIKNIEPITGADRIEVVTVLGWKLVSRKGEFKPGDLCVYFEIDSILPKAEWNSFLQDKDKPEKPIRLKTMKFRGQISQGLAMPLSILGNGNAKLEGDDLTKFLGVEKYEPPIPACLNGEVQCGRPSWVPMTDEERIQAHPELIDEFMGKKVYITQKIDGTSSSFSNLDGKIHISGRNWSYRESEKNTYWQTFHKYNLGEVLKKAGNYVIQGEIAGEGIQKNRLKLKGHQLFVFNIIHIEGRRKLGYQEIVNFCSDNGLQTVPVLEVAVFDWDLDQLLEKADKHRYPGGLRQEGIVIRPTEPCYSRALSSSASFKVINNKYLMLDDE